ncbi:CBS domain-containing protein [Salinilacihabitans rarus]|uniref:CBS domain-containing protein n=1 Tax=Salinilacihabitans rarus TaxID=2961596 RepID=UPI0020C8B0D8|nr:CBS domain-containing protein [Salinilacihabitans rarus]
MAVQQIAEPDVVTAHRDDGVEDVVEKMATENVGSVVIVEDGSPVGIVTDRTIALSIREVDDVADQTVDDLMAADLATVSADAGVFDVIRTLSDEGVRRVPVVDDGGSLEGIVSLDDLIVLLADEFGGISTVIEQQAPRF